MKARGDDDPGRCRRGAGDAAAQRPGRAAEVTRRGAAAAAGVERPAVHARAIRSSACNRGSRRKWPSPPSRREGSRVRRSTGATCPPTPVWCPAGKLALPVKRDAADPNAAVRLTLLTSQFVPLGNNQPDPNKALRPEKPVELPASEDRCGRHHDRSCRRCSTRAGYDVAVQAELLAADKTDGAGHGVHPGPAAAVRQPVALVYDGPPKIEVDARRQDRDDRQGQGQGRAPRGLDRRRGADAHRPAAGRAADAGHGEGRREPFAIKCRARTGLRRPARWPG